MSGGRGGGGGGGGLRHIFFRSAIYVDNYLATEYPKKLRIMLNNSQIMLDYAYIALQKNL